MLEWTRKQKRIYQRLRSWMTERVAEGCQLLRVDLTTAQNGRTDKDLTADFRELRKRVKRHFGYQVDYFKIQTAEGHGVLHMVWAVKEENAVYIPHSWLSAVWLDIHGASVVWISRLKRGGGNKKRVAQYMAAQYLANQDAVVRISYSWFHCKMALGKCWQFVKRQAYSMSKEVTMCGLSQHISETSYKEMLWCWESLLNTGKGIMAGIRYQVWHREVIRLHGVYSYA